MTVCFPMFVRCTPGRTDSSKAFVRRFIFEFFNAYTLNKGNLTLLMGLLFDAFVVQVKSVLLKHTEKSNIRTKFRKAAEGFSE